MPGESLESIAERLENAADRARNGGLMVVAQAAQEAARQVRVAPSVDAALAIEQAFMGVHASSGEAPPRSWWWRLTHPGSWFSSDYDLSDDS